MCLLEGRAEGWTCRETWAASPPARLRAASSLGRVLLSLPLRSDQGPREVQRLSTGHQQAVGAEWPSQWLERRPDPHQPYLVYLPPWCVLAILEGQLGPWPGQERGMGTTWVTSSAVHFREEQRTGRPGATPQTGL